MLSMVKIGETDMTSITAPKRFSIWTRIEGSRRPGISGVRDAYLWPDHEHREVDMSIVRRCGLTHGFEALVVGTTVCCERNRLTGLMVREREATRFKPGREIEIDRVLGLRDVVYQRLMLGSHAAIDNSVVRSMSISAVGEYGSARRAHLDALGRFIARRGISAARVAKWIADIEEGSLLEDPQFNSSIRVA
jgi:predicted transcriptional regulator